MEDRRLLRLIRKARAGNNDAFCELMNMKARSIMYTATCLMGSKADAEDAAQEAIISIGKNIRTLKKAENFDAWVYRIVYNVCLKEKKKQRRGNTVDVEIAEATIAEKREELLPGQTIEKEVDMDRFETALRSLPDHYRLALLMFYYDNASYAQIAEALNVSENTVPNMMRRAKDKLRDSFEQEGEAADADPVRHHMAFSAAALSSAFTQSELQSVTSANLAQLQATIAQALPTYSVFAKLTTTAKAAACLVTVMGAAGVVVSGHAPYQEPVPQPAEEVSLEAAAQAEQPVFSEEPGFTAYIESQSEKVPLAVVVKDEDSAEWAAFEKTLPDLSSVGETEVDGYLCTIYKQGEGDGEQYFAVVEDGGHIGTEAIPITVLLEAI